MLSKTIASLLAGILLLLADCATAQVFGGRLDDITNAALVGSDLGAASFADADAVADNVALYGFTVSFAGTVTIQSTGFGAGGADPYFTLFSGSDLGATFADSNYAQAFATGGDFYYSASLAAGSYQLALGTLANMSFAENSGSGTLADGFIGFGQAGSLGDAHYRVVVTAPTVITPMPEPSTLLLLSVSLMALGIRLRAPR